MKKVAVVGGSGFVGSAVRFAAERHGAEVVGVSAPHLRTRARSPEELMDELPLLAGVEDALTRELSGADVIINAAGIATAHSGADDALFGANAALPALLARVARSVGARFIHVSSAAVQGRRAVLDETDETSPFSPYSASKALGEAVVLDAGDHVVVFRPTSVHGPGRPLTETLTRVLGSRAASVAAPGTDPTPQVHVDNVADALVFAGLSAEQPPRIVLQPAEGFTTSSLVREIGHREPLMIPRPLARVLVGTLFLIGRLSGRFSGVARRVEMMWFGQRQVDGWLASRWKPVTRLGDGRMAR